MAPQACFFHHPLRSFASAVVILLLFVTGTPFIAGEMETLPVFSQWRNQPPPSGHPLRVQYLLDGTYYEAGLTFITAILSPH